MQPTETTDDGRAGDNAQPDSDGRREDAAATPQAAAPQEDRAAATARSLADRICWRCVFGAAPLFLLTLAFGWLAAEALERGRLSQTLDAGAATEELSDLSAQNAELLIELSELQDELAAARAAMLAAGDGGVEALTSRIAALPPTERAALLARAGADLTEPPDNAREALAVIENLPADQRADLFSSLSGADVFAGWFDRLDSAERRRWLESFLGQGSLDATDINFAPLNPAPQNAPSEPLTPEALSPADVDALREAAADAEAARVAAADRQAAAEAVLATTQAEKAVLEADFQKLRTALDRERSEGRRAARAEGLRVGRAQAEARAQGATADAVAAAEEGIARNPEGFLDRVDTLPAAQKAQVYARLAGALPADAGFRGWLSGAAPLTRAAFVNSWPADDGPALGADDGETAPLYAAALKAEALEASMERIRADLAAALEGKAVAEAALENQQAALAAAQATARTLETAAADDDRRLATLSAELDAARGAEQEAKARLTALSVAEAKNADRVLALEEAVTEARAAQRAAEASARDAAESAAQQDSSAALAQLQTKLAAAQERTDTLETAAAAQTEQAEAARRDAETELQGVLEAADAAAKSAASRIAALETALDAAHAERDAAAARAEAVTGSQTDREKELTAALAEAEAKAAAPPPPLTFAGLGEVAWRDAPTVVAAALDDRDRALKSLRAENAALTRRLGAAAAAASAEAVRTQPARSTRDASAQGGGPETEADAGAATRLQETPLSRFAAGAPDTLAGSMAFDSGSATLTRRGKSAVIRLARKLRRRLAARPEEEWRLVVEGHTDQLPIRTKEFPSNWELSAARAASVARYLNQNGVPSARLITVGKADQDLLDRRFNRRAFAKNRRIEFSIRKP